LPVEVLIIRLSAIGDVVHALPVASAIKKHVEGVRITWVVEPTATPLLLDNPVVDEVLIFPGKSLFGALNSFSFQRTKLAHAARFIEKLRSRHFDAALDLQGLMKSALITYFSGATLRIGFKGTREFAPLFLTHAVDVGDYFGHGKPVVELNLSLAQKLFELLGSKQISPLVADFRLPEPKAESIERIASELATKDGLPPNMMSSRAVYAPLAVLVPGTTWTSKIWPAKYWCQLAEMLAGILGYRIILAGSAFDLKTNNTIEETIKTNSHISVLNMTGKTSLADLVSLFHQTQLVVGADTGPLHIAAAVGKPKVVGIFGATPSIRNGPYGKQCTTIALGLECQPCFEKICPLGTLACLKDMSAQYVFERLRKFIDNT
jgi:heptosyltransferase-1